MTTFKPLRFAFVLAGTVVLALAAGPAFAHAELLSEVPAAESVAESPLKDLRLSFSEALNLPFCKLSLTDSTGNAITVGELALDAQDDKVLVAPLSDTLPAGTYKVDWTAVSNDGHKSTGTYTFKAN
jgi:hypothetical protein